MELIDGASFNTDALSEELAVCTTSTVPLNPDVVEIVHLSPVFVAVTVELSSAVHLFRPLSYLTVTTMPLLVSVAESAELFAVFSFLYVVNVRVGSLTSVTFPAAFNVRVYS